MKYQEPSPEEYLNIAEKVRSGEYFREAQAMYDVTVNDPMAERYFYIALTIVALITALAAFYAAQALYPLSRSTPFIYKANDPVEEVPHIRSLKEYQGQAPDEAVLHFMIANFVRLYEEYSIKTLDRSLSGIQSQASDKVFAAYQVLMNPNNPDSPVMRYQRHSIRTIQVVSVKNVEGTKDQCEAIFDAVEQGREEAKKTRFVANITFRYSGIQLDEGKNTIKPIEFQVTEYHTRRIQD
jgi:type IV secretion system protein VirB8